jgi:hypothetical protein
LPIKNIGENNWVKNLNCFLEYYDIEVFPLENVHLIKEIEQYLEWKIPDSIIEYYKYFGGIDDHDFMYNLKKINEFKNLSNSNWEFIKTEFEENIIKKFIVFSESPANEPLCINKKSGEIYIFSHDPLKYAKVYKNFNDYFIDEIINLKELMGDLEFTNKDEKFETLKELLSGEEIDYEIRLIKLE